MEVPTFAVAIMGIAACAAGGALVAVLVHRAKAHEAVREDPRTQTERT